MSKDLIPNPPSPEFVKKAVDDAGTSATWNTTREVRAAISRAIKADRYEEMTRYMYGGKITGSAQADMYSLARFIVKCDADAHHTALNSAMENGDIRLVDIVKRIAPEFRKLKVEVRRGVCVGTTDSMLQEKPPVKLAV